MSGVSDVALAGARSAGDAVSHDAVYREIFDMLEDGVFVHDGKTGRIVDVNAGACALFGCDRAELLGSSVGALSAEEDGYTEERARARISEALGEGKVRFEWRSKRANGTRFWSEVRLVRSELGGCERVLAIVRDISAVRAATEASRLAEERYRVLVRSMPNNAVVLCDHDLRIVLVDGPEVKASGMSKEAMEGRTIWEVFPPEFVTLIEGNMRRMLAGDSFSAELPFENNWFVYNYVPLRNDAGEVLYGMILAHNITERRRAEDALRSSELRLAKIFQSSPDAIGVSRRSDGMLLQVNASFERLLGWSQAEAVGSKTTELALWSDGMSRERLLEMIESPGGLDGAEIPARRKDGSVVVGQLSIRHIEFDGVPCHLFTFRDCTEQLRARHELEASEARLRALVDSTFEGVAITEHGRIADANDQLASMFGLRREEMVGRSILSFVPPEAQASVEDKVRSADQGPYEHQALRHDGTRMLVEVRARRVQVEGRMLRTSAIRDITEDKKAEAERERLIAELRARNAEMEQFTYTVSHDLKSPLVTISGFLGMLEQDIAQGDQARMRTDIERIGSAASNMMRLLNDLLELSRVGRVGRAAAQVRLGDVFDDAIERVSGLISERGVRVLRPDQELPEVYGDRARLAQVAQNLLENAVKYMGPQANPVVELGVRPSRDGVVWFVRDNGIGVDPRYAERIFGLFEKLNPRSEGTGIGLALVRRIVEFHGGRVTVESDGKSGSTFVVQLARGPADGAGEHAKEPSQ